MRTPLLPLVLLAACQSTDAPPPPAGPPNILFVFTDDHAAHAIGAYGSIYPDVTPNIDRIASEGVLFTNTFCGNSICAPSRATILTGLHSHANGIRGNAERFDGSQPTFPKALQAAGYQTAMLGKWHLKTDPTGFDHWEVLPGQGHYYNPDFRTPEGRHQREGYVTEIITDLALDWLRDERDPEKPFLLMVQHKAPHREWMPGPDHHHLFAGQDLPEPATLFDDYQGRASAAAEHEMGVRDHLWEFYDLKVEPADPEAELSGPDRWARGRMDRMTPEHRALWEAAYAEENAAFRAANLTGEDLVRWKYQRYMKDYLKCVAAVDDGIGQLLDELEAQGLAENTLVVYSSDQGFYLGDHGWYDKRWMYEESLRMPLVMRWPGHIEPGTREPRLTQNIDFAATFLDVAGAAPMETHGVSLAPLMAGAPVSSWRDAIYYHYTEYPQPHRVARHYGVRTENHKLIHYYERGEWELFDLRSDPDELRSVYDERAYGPLRETLQQRLKELQQQYGDDAVSPDAGR